MSGDPKLQIQQMEERAIGDFDEQKRRNAHLSSERQSVESILDRFENDRLSRRMAR